MPGRGRGEKAEDSEGAFEADAVEPRGGAYRRRRLSRETEDDADAEAHCPDARHDASDWQLPGCQLVWPAAARRIAQAGGGRTRHLAAIHGEASSIFARLGAVDGAEGEEADTGSQQDPSAHYQPETGSASSGASVRGFCGEDDAAVAVGARVAAGARAPAATAVARVALEVDADPAAGALRARADNCRRNDALRLGSLLRVPPYRYDPVFESLSIRARGKLTVLPDDVELLERLGRVPGRIEADRQVEPGFGARTRPICNSEGDRVRRRTRLPVLLPVSISTGTARLARGQLILPSASRGLHRLHRLRDRSLRLSHWLALVVPPPVVTLTPRVAREQRKSRGDGPAEAEPVQNGTGKGMPVPEEEPKRLLFLFLSRCIHWPFSSFRMAFHCCSSILPGSGD